MAWSDRLFPSQLSLKARVSWAVAILFLIALGLQAWLTLRQFAQEYRQMIHSRVFDLATVIADDLDYKLRTYRDMLVAAVEQLPHQALRDPELAQRFLDQQVALKTVMDNGLLLVSEEGRIVADSRGVPGLRGRDVRHLDVFQGVSRTRAPYISKPFTSLREGRLHALSIGIPILDGEGRMIGRLHGSFDLHGRNFLSDLASYRIGRSGYIGLLTRDRLILTHQDPARIMQRNQPGQNPIVDRAIEGFEGSGRTRNLAGVELLSSVKHLKTTDWILVVNLPAEEAEEPLQRAVLRAALAVGALASTVLLLIWLVMKAELSPLQRIASHLRALPELPREQRQLPAEGSGELRTLVDSFNSMLRTMERQREEVEASEARFRSLAEMSIEWYWEQDEHFRFTLMSQGLRKTGVTIPLGKTRWELPIEGVTPQQWAEHRACLQRHESFRNFVYRVRADDGSLRTFSISGIPMFDSQGNFKGYRGIGCDITEQRASEERIAFLAYHDALTGLPNRLLAQDRFEQAMAQADRQNLLVALVYLDLDNFKTINDSLGHAVGDEFLGEVARRLRNSVRETDTVSRLGGDEFLLVLRDLPDTDVVTAIVTKLMQSLQQPMHLGAHEVSTSASVGIAVAPRDGRDFDTLRKKADLAMYRSKETGRNTWHFFDPSMDAEAGEHLRLRNGLRRALQWKEFELHYQPQYDLRNGRLIGVEALLRWRDPESGLIGPARFIRIAEESGLIIPIGEWVLQQACMQAAQWRRAGWSDLTISVNLSALQFRHGQLHAVIDQALNTAVGYRLHIWSLSSQSPSCCRTSKRFWPACGNSSAWGCGWPSMILEPATPASPT